MAKYSYEFKLQVVQAYLDGEGGYRYLSKKYGVPSKRDIEKYAIAIDLDGVEEKHIGSLFKQFSNGRIYPPNIVVSSGNGLHLYYILKEPIALFDNVKELMKRFKYGLIDLVWSSFTSK